MKSIIGLLAVALALVAGCAGAEDGEGTPSPETKTYTLGAGEVAGGNCGALAATSMAFRAEDTGHTYFSDTAAAAGYHDVVRIEWSEDSATGKGVLYRSALNGNCTSFYNVTLTPVAAQ